MQWATESQRTILFWAASGICSVALLWPATVTVCVDDVAQELKSSPRAPINFRFDEALAIARDRVPERLHRAESIRWGGIAGMSLLALAAIRNRRQSS